MTDLIINSIAKVLSSNFNAAKVYSEKAKQHFKSPAFFINEKESSYKQIGLYAKKSQTILVLIKYYPSNEIKPRMECQAMANQLCKLLELIKIEDYLIRGSKIKVEIVEDVLHFYVTYNINFYLEKPSGDSMQNMNFKEEVKK